MTGVYEDIFIKPSPYVSGLCYSVFRLEPYEGCAFSCSYCYSKWYRSRKWPGGRVVIERYSRIARWLNREGLVFIPFRLATLSDPLQPAEEKSKLSLSLMRVALRYEQPIVVSTKSTLIAKEPWLSVMEDLASSGLLVLQISVASISDRIRKFEGAAPPPQQLLDAARAAADRGIPIVVRYQPVIPGISDVDEEIERAFDEFSDIGVKMVVAEYLREERERLRLYEAIAENREAYGLEWERYGTGDRSPARPPLSYRIRGLKKLRDAAQRRGMKFATCKEGLFDLHTSEDCCGFYLLDKSSYALRPTLAEVYRVVRGSPAEIDRLKILISRLGNFIAEETLEEYPRFLRKPLQWHNRVLWKVLTGPDLPRVTPLLRFEGGIVKAVKPEI